MKSLTGRSMPVDSRTVRDALVIRPAGRNLPDAAVREIARMEFCKVGKCVAQWIDDRRFVLLSRRDAGGYVAIVLLSQDNGGSGWSTNFLNNGASDINGDIEQAAVEARQVMRRQIYVNGQPVGDVID